jgi:glycerol kinase
VLLNVGPELRAPGDATVATIAWTHRGKPTYCFEGIINYSAGTIDWLKNQLGLIRDAAETEQAATSVDDNGGVYLVPAFAGLSAPYWAPGARAAIVGMTAHATRNHVIRAALESIAYQLRDVLDTMRERAPSTGSGQAFIELRAISADGGATRNAFLMQFIADMTGLDIAAARIAECSPLGAALAGAVGMNLHPSIDALASLPRDVVTYHPQMPAEQVTKWYDGWKRAVHQVLAGVSP